MRIRRLLIQNFKGIQRVHMTDLEDVITIAGKNGCGKTCLLEGIRLLKSQYGQYNENENRAWWDEKQVDLREAGAPRKVLRDTRRQAVVEAEIELARGEKDYIRDDPNHLAEIMAIRTIAPGIESQIEYRLREWSLRNWRAIPGLAERGREITEAAQRIREEIERGLASRTTTGRFDIGTDGRIDLRPNVVLTFIFSTFDPRRLGIIEFNPADRRYPPERFTNVTVDVEKQDEAWKQSAMYNTEGKYGGVKEALGNEWIRSIIRREAGETEATEEMATAMREIFRDMIPDKEFEGPRPTPEGRLEFNVMTGTNQHDIDDLSSGEKEILFGYLKTRARAPKNSVIIVDEPELHLNPRMIAGLPNLYERHIGRALQNQVWLVTHSDMFLRRAFESGRMQVFHMDMPRDEDSTFDQIRHVGTDERFERACLELIGDFATYEPQGTTILVEGGSKFDEEMITRLFSAELRGVNVLSIAGKNEVIKKKKDLWGLQDQQGITKGVVTITDGDGACAATRAQEERDGQFRWDLYDVESYLLDAEYIAQAVEQLCLRRRGDVTTERVRIVLRHCAQEVMQELIESQLVEYVRRKLREPIKEAVRRPDCRGPITDEDMARLASGCRTAAARINEAAHATTEEELRKELRRLQKAGDSNDLWEAGSWKKVVPGKRVLQKAAETLAGRAMGAQVRNVTIALMGKDGHRPRGMMKTIRKALAYQRKPATSAQSGRAGARRT